MQWLVDHIMQYYGESCELLQFIRTEGIYKLDTLYCMLSTIR